MQVQSFAIDLPTQDETESLGAALASVAQQGDCLLLRGQIGAGKSCLARAFIKTLLGANTEVPSPTFTLVQVYEGPNFEVWHADLYRLGDTSEVIELGLLEAMEENVCLIEWPELLGDLAPKNSLCIELASNGSGREARLTAPEPWWTKLKGLTGDA